MSDLKSTGRVYTLGAAAIVTDALLARGLEEGHDFTWQLVAGHGLADHELWMSDDAYARSHQQKEHNG